MKKLLVAVAIACSSTVSQAALANWKASAANIYNGSGSAEASAKYSGTAYLFDAGITTQASLYKLIADAVSKNTAFDATVASGYVASGTVSSGSLPNTTAFAYGDRSTSSSDLKNYSFYFILLDDDNVYFSNTKSVAANANDAAKSIGFGNQATGSQLAPTTAGEYAGEGKWSSVPEPTSAMLLMLGLCGLALKRKNA